MSTMLGHVISVLIVIINYILRIVIIKLTFSIRQDTQSERLAATTNGVFIAQFFNTGFVLTLVNANMSEHSPTWLTALVANKFYDYGPQWYPEVGLLICKTMFINSIMPYVTLCTSFAIPAIKRRLSDGNDPYKDKKTKVTSMAQFKTLWSGADYVIHFKFANVLNVVYVSMMYGAGMPILFPIAAFNFLNQYICERIIVAYFMK